jgi:aminobenzoyl-glutamate utilization protein B
MATTLVPLVPPPPAFGGGISTDTADVSWHAPTATALVATFPPGAPNHNWSVTAAVAMNIGHQGTLRAAQYLAATTVDLITKLELLDGMREEFRQRTAGVQWTGLIPDGTQPPLYEPLADFLAQTGQHRPPKGFTWPVSEVVSAEHLGSTGPDLPRVT